MMTGEQKRLVEDNMRLVTWYIKRRVLDFEEWLGPLSETLCMAAMEFNPDRNTKFSTLAVKMFNNVVNNEMRFQNSKKRKPEIGMVYADSFNCSGDGDEVSLWDIIPDPRYNVEREAISNVQAEILVGKVKGIKNRLWRKVALMRMDGYTQTEIAEAFGVTRARIHTILKEVGKCIEKERTTESKEKAEGSVGGGVEEEVGKDI